MRTIHVQVAAAQAERMVALAREHGAATTAGVRLQRLPGEDAERTLLVLTLPNQRIGDFVDAVRRHAGDDAQLLLLPLGTLPLQQPLDELHEQVTDVSRLSTLEMVVGSLQSAGSWRGMLVYSVLAGTVAACGFILDVMYLLVAAMLINPMGAPAMVAVIGVSVGDAWMFWRGAVRFVVSLLVQALAALLLGFAYGLSVPTAMMELVTSLSLLAVVVAAAAGAAGAQSQVQSERDSLVSGSAAGFMVAAALAPPAAVLGLAVPLGRWDYVLLMTFLLVLQFFAIAAGGWLALLIAGVSPGEPSAGHGRRGRRSALVALVFSVAIGMTAWQTQLAPRFQRADLSRDALEIAREAVEQLPAARFVEATARFTRPDLERHEGETMIIEVFVERVGDVAAPDDVIEGDVRRAVERRVDERMRRVVPFVHVTVLPPAAAGRSRD